MARFITTKADFTLRRKHKTASGMTVYENDYTTINPMPNAFKNEYVIGDSNFKFTTRYGVNGQRKHTRGRFIPNPSGEASAWTMDTLINSAITPETKIKLKPNYTSIRDFVCYGSAEKLIQGTINGVIADFPAELYFSEDKLALYKGDVDGTYSFDNTKELAATENIIYNEYNIDIISTNVREEDAYNPMRFFALCGTSYNFMSGTDEYEIISFAPNPMASGSCVDGTPVEVEKINEVEITFRISTAQTGTVKINVYKDYVSNRLYWTAASGEPGCRIRPKREVIETYFDNLDDFTSVLLNRETNPLYRAVFETPRETATGIYYDMIPYVWPTLHGGFNPDLSDGYYAYVESLVGLSEFYDEYFTDNMWRSLTHEAIKTLDWTYLATTGDDTEDMSTIDTSRIEPITKIYGRQFDDLKRYADGIKAMNTVTYNQKSNMPDYTLTDALSNSGWETKVLNITSDKDIRTEPLYSGLSIGYTSSDANTDFLRRLKLNSRYLFSSKGTRKSLDTLLALLGFSPDEYKIHEYVQVANPGDYGEYPHFCIDTSGKTFAYPLAKDVATINKYKINFNPNDPYGDYCGIPVAEIGFVSAGTDYSYVVPWYSQNKKYDDGLYFQMAGGWGNRDTKDIELDIAPDISFITNESGVSIYDETQTRLKFANDFDELLQQAYVSAITNDVCYVTDISDITDRYEFKEQEEPQTGLSHYFVLEDAELNQMLGFSASLGKYGWRNIKESEITENSTSAGTLVLYLESLKEDTTGNNPHVGNGLYDNGQGYIDSMSDIFGYSLNNNNFIGLTNEQCENIQMYTFSCLEYEDNRKSWYFSDDYNHRLGKDKNEQIFLEADVTEDVCDVKNYSGDTAYILSAYGKDNEIKGVGMFAADNFDEKSPDTGKTSCLYYNRATNMLPFNPELPGEYPNGEAAANSVINVKNMTIDFTPRITSDMKDDMRRYINNAVIPYITQMIPSTTILSWSFSGANLNPEVVTEQYFTISMKDQGGGGGEGGGSCTVFIPQARDTAGERVTTDAEGREWIFYGLEGEGKKTDWTDESHEKMRVYNNKIDYRTARCGYVITPTLASLYGSTTLPNVLKITMDFSDCQTSGSAEVNAEVVGGGNNTFINKNRFKITTGTGSLDFYVTRPTSNTRLRFYVRNPMDNIANTGDQKRLTMCWFEMKSQMTVSDTTLKPAEIPYFKVNGTAFFLSSECTQYKITYKTNCSLESVGSSTGYVPQGYYGGLNEWKVTAGLDSTLTITLPQNKKSIPRGVSTPNIRIRTYNKEREFDWSLMPDTETTFFIHQYESNNSPEPPTPTENFPSAGTLTLQGKLVSKMGAKETYVDVTNATTWELTTGESIATVKNGVVSWTNNTPDTVEITVRGTYEDESKEIKIKVSGNNSN